MPTKRPKTAQKDSRDAIIAAALKLAAKRDWDNVTLKDIAKAAGLSLADVAAVFESREDILQAYGRMIDRDMLAAYPDGVPGNTDKDKLFDILMERFDRLNNDRAALVSIITASCRDPKNMVIGLPGVAKSMVWVMEACAMETGGWRGAAKLAGLSAIYLWTLKTWKDDDSADMSKTMAVLDRALDRAGSWSDSLGL